MSTPLFLPSGFILTTNPTSNQLDAAAELGPQVSNSDTYPDARPLAERIQRGKENQHASYWVGLILHTYPHPEHVIAQALIQPAHGDNWNHPITSNAFENKTLFELTGLFVLPDYRQQGIANFLKHSRLAVIDQHHFTACVSVWDDSPSHHMYRSDPEWEFLGGPYFSTTKRPYWRFARPAKNRP